jgi:hypothetical protein
MTATDTNGQQETSAYWSELDPVASVGIPVTPLGEVQPPPPPPPPAPRTQPVAPVQQAQPVMPAPQRVMSAPPGYQVGAWPTHPNDGRDADDDLAPPVSTPARARRSEVEPVPSSDVEKVSPFRPLGAWWKNSRRRSRTLTIVGVCVLSLLGGRAVLGWAGGVIGNASARGASAGADAALAARPAPSGQTNTVVIPTDWFPCQLTTLASTAVGYDASTGSKTLDPVRAAEVARQVRVVLSAGGRITDMYISTPAATSIIVSNGPVPDGTPLFNCSGTAVPAKQDGTTATSAPGGATTATSAPR